MASSAKETNGTFKGPISYKLSKKSWTEIIISGSLKNSNVMSEAPIRSLQAKLIISPPALPAPLSIVLLAKSLDVTWHLTGTVPHSIIINVLDKKKTFIVLYAKKTFQCFVKLRFYTYNFSNICWN